MITAADLRREDVGVEVAFTMGDTLEKGILKAVQHVAGLVQMQVDQQTYVVSEDWLVHLPFEHIRKRALKEPDIDLRHKFLDEAVAF